MCLFLLRAASKLMCVYNGGSEKDSSCSCTYEKEENLHQKRDYIHCTYAGSTQKKRFQDRILSLICFLPSSSRLWPRYIMRKIRRLVPYIQIDLWILSCVIPRLGKMYHEKESFYGPIHIYTNDPKVNPAQRCSFTNLNILAELGSGCTHIKERIREKLEIYPLVYW